VFSIKKTYGSKTSLAIYSFGILGS
jgi:hypothetical protein